MQRPEISVVVPAFNEEDNIPRVVPRFLESLSAQRRPFELILVNDGSRDCTGELFDRFAAVDPRVRVIHLARNYGQTAAMMSGFLASSAPVVVALDGDGQNEPDDVQMLVDKLEEGFDVVSGWRKDRKDSLPRRVVSRAANRLIGHVTGVRLHDYGCTLKAYRAHMVRDARLFGEMHRFIPVYTSMHGARITEMIVRHHPRVAGRSKYGMGRIVKVLLDLILVRMLQRYGSKPIHFFGRITQWSWLATVLCLGFAFAQAIQAGLAAPAGAAFDAAWVGFWGKAPLVGLMFFLLGFFAIMLGLVAELTMRAAYEFNGGRYWEEARRVNFASARVDAFPQAVTRFKSQPVVEWVREPLRR